MNIRIRSTKSVVSDAEFRASRANVSFPAVLDVATLAAHGADPVLATPRPDTDDLHVVLMDSPVKDSLGNWVQAWRTISRFADFTDADGVLHTKTEQEDAYTLAALNARLQALQTAIVAAVQARLDDFARTRNYDGVLSAASYATSSVQQFSSEGQYAVEARDATWSALYAILEAVKAGDRPAPLGFSEIESELPGLAWPE